MAVREVNSSGVVSGDLTVNGVNVGTAVAAYTTANAAILAGSADDHIVLSEAMAFGLTGVGYTVSTAMRFSVADGVRAARDTHSQNDGGYISNAYSVANAHTSGDVIWEGFSRNLHGGNSAWTHTGTNGTTWYSNCIGKTSSIYGHFGFGTSLGTGKCVIDHYRLEMGDGSASNCGFAWNFAAGDKNVEIYNCGIIITNTTTTHSHVIRGQSGSQRVIVCNTFSTEASGATAPTTAHGANLVAPDTITAGHNASDDDTLPGTTTYALDDASDITETVDESNYSFNQTRDQQDAYPGADVSGLVYSGAAGFDFDLDTRTDWSIGTDWSAPAASGARKQPTATRMRARTGM